MTTRSARITREMREEDEAAMAARLARRELESRIIRTMGSPPSAWGDIRGGLQAFTSDQLERIAAICEEPRTT